MTRETASYVSNHKKYILRLRKKLRHLPTSIKTYWDTLRSLWNGKEVLDIPPVLVNNELIIEFEATASMFNKHFTRQCTTFSINSLRSLTLNNLTDDKLSSFNISPGVIFQSNQKS